jgi:hypothetical protein
MTRIPPERLILALPDIELEKFVREWVLLKKHMLGSELRRITVTVHLNLPLVQLSALSPQFS